MDIEVPADVMKPSSDTINDIREFLKDENQIPDDAELTNLRLKVKSGKVVITSFNYYRMDI